MVSSGVVVIARALTSWDTGSIPVVTLYIVFWLFLLTMCTDGQ